MASVPARRHDGRTSRSGRQPCRDPVPNVTVAFALVKGQKPELVVQKLTELGVDSIVPYLAERSVVRWDVDRAATNRKRLIRVAREAAMQSRRCWLPDIAAVATFAGVAALPEAVMADRGGAPLTLATSTVLVGPEGGWSAGERQTGLPAVGLSEHVLRAETAAIAAGVALCGLRAGFWAPIARPHRAGKRHFGLRIVTLPRTVVDLAASNAYRGRVNHTRGEST